MRSSRPRKNERIPHEKARRLPRPRRRLRSAGADTTLDYNVLHAGKKSGAQKTVIGDDGRMHVSYSYRDNGRGPDIEEDIALLPDGTIRSYRQRGKTTYGAVLDERFSAARGRASWQSPSERGSQELAGAAIYLPSYGSPETSAIIVRATQKAGGQLPALPGGELRSEKLADARVGPAGQERAGRAVCDFRRRAATGLRLARGERGDAPFRQHQRGRKPHGRGRLRERDARSRAATQADAEATYLADIAKKHTHSLAAADPRQERSRFRYGKEEPWRAVGRLRQRWPHRRDLSGGLAGEGSGDRHRRRGTRAAARPLRHAYARGCLEFDPADRRRRHDLARHGQRQRLPGEAAFATSPVASRSGRTSSRPATSRARAPLPRAADSS